jgi:hypothetical protein
LEVAENLLIKFFIETKTKKLFRVYQWKIVIII